MKIGVIGAMIEEIQCIMEAMKIEEMKSYAGMVFYIGIVHDTEVVLVMSGIGKVNAALCAQILITKFQVEGIINTGLAGALDESLEIGDIVVSNELLEHDMDATGFGYELGVIPRMDKSIFVADPKLIELAAGVIKEKKRVHVGRIVSGDVFVADAKKRIYLNKTFGGLCAEMEGAAIAHVCHVNKKPFVIIRTISDNADNSATENFSEFVKEHAHESSRVVIELIKKMEMA
ncbi:MAG: 5'-methylthioadenosine/adenosylhomocysteine nucleosidase [Peptostreptococcaceae bacterium]|nr:5'-methylthioadenosine/adenosylhomocysteine nucleosidase [Peptostreptococcaceae bacterium]